MRRAPLCAQQRVYLECIWSVSGVYLGRVWSVSGVSVSGVYLGCIWGVSGVCLECIWNVSGVYLGCIWSVSGVAKGVSGYLECIWSVSRCIWSVSGVYLGCIWGVSGVYLECIWNVSEKCSKHMCFTMKSDRRDHFTSTKWPQCYKKHVFYNEKRVHPAWNLAGTMSAVTPCVHSVCTLCVPF